MTKLYRTQAIAQVQATKLTKKTGIAYEPSSRQTGGWVVLAALPKVVPPPAEVRTVTLTLPLTTMSPTYIGARVDGKEIWFDRKSLINHVVEGDTLERLVTLTMDRSKAVRRKLLAAA